MKKRPKRKSVSATPWDEPGAVDPISKLQQQLSAMEKKLDILISQSFKRPFNNSYRHDRGGQGNGPRERTYTRVVCSECNKECEIPFKPSPGHPVYCKECFSKRKQGNPFNANRGNRPEGRDFPRERHFGKKQAKRKQKPDTKKKPFYARIKKRG